MKGLLFTYAMTYGGAVFSLYRPFYGLLIYVCFAIIRPPSLWPWSVAPGPYSQIIAIALLVGWVINGFGDWNLGRSWRSLVFLVGFLAWASLSGLLAADDQAIAAQYVIALSKIVLPVVVGLTLIHTRKQLELLAWVILVSQAYVAWEFNLSYLQGVNRLYGPVASKFGGMDNNCVAIAMVTGAGLAFFMGMHQHRAWKKWLCFLCAGLMAHTVMLAFSRGGMLALLIVGMVAFVLIDKSPRHFGLFALAVVAGLILAGPEVRDRFWTAFADAEERDASAESRVVMWGQCLQIMASHPVLGIGPDHWPLVASTFGWHKGKEAHTLWLQTGAETGLVGLLLMLGYYVGTAQRALRIARRKAPAVEFDVMVARMLIASLAGFIVAAQFVSLEGLELPYYITMIGAGLLKIRSLEERGVPRAVPSPVGYGGHAVGRGWQQAYPAHGMRAGGGC